MHETQRIIFHIYVSDEKILFIFCNYQIEINLDLISFVLEVIQNGFQFLVHLIEPFSSWFYMLNLCFIPIKGDNLQASYIVYQFFPQVNPNARYLARLELSYKVEHGHGSTLAQLLTKIDTTNVIQIRENWLKSTFETKIDLTT